MKRRVRSDFERGRRSAAALLAQLVRASDWDPRSRKRLRALVRLVGTLSLPDNKVIARAAGLPPIHPLAARPRLVGPPLHVGPPPGIRPIKE